MAWAVCASTSVPGFSYVSAPYMLILDAMLRFCNHVLMVKPSTKLMWRGSEMMYLRSAVPAHGQSSGLMLAGFSWVCLLNFSVVDWTFFAKIATSYKDVNLFITDSVYAAHTGFQLIISLLHLLSPGITGMRYHTWLLTSGRYSLKHSWKHILALFY